MRILKTKLKYLIFSIVLLLMTNFNKVYSQLDTVFWFAAPEVAIANLTFDRPIYLWITSSNAPSQVTITQPANPAFTPIILNLLPLSTNFVDLTNWIDQLECKPANQVHNYGIKITATNPITAYYEVVSLQCNCNPEIFALKGRNGLGTNFFIPMQNFLANSNHSSYQPTPYCSFDIVASQDNTMVTITPTANIVGHIANIPFTITLNEGETYSATATSQLASQHLNGSIVTANNPIAVTIKDDLIQNSTCADLAGDQLVPIEHIGTKYIVVKGFLTGTTDRVFILGTQNNTSVTINGIVVGTINSGQTYAHTLNTSNAAYIETSKPVYVLQLSGFGCEVGYSIIPQIECSGSNEVSFTRSTNNPLHITLIVPQGGEGNFLLNGVSGIINSSSFTDVPSTSGTWKYAQITFNETQIPIGTTTKISNTSNRFHLGFIHGNSNNGCRFGYFSDFAKYNFEITANQTIFCEGDTLLLSTNTIEDATYIWNGPNNFSSNESNIEYFPLSSFDEGYYSINGFLGNCPIEPDSIFIQVFSSTSIFISPENPEVCLGESIVFNVVGPGVIQYEWSTGETESTIEVIPIENSTYSVTGTNEIGCISTIETGVIVKPIPQIYVSPSVAIVTEGESITLQVFSDIPTTTFEWNNGDITPIITITPMNTMTLYVEGNADGCLSDTSITITVLPVFDEDFSIYIPNSFTPNNDGLNDLFAPKGENIEFITFLIYNRWGELIYQSYESFPSWDGFSNGKLVPSGVYIYFVRYIKADTGALKQKQGSVTLIR